MDLRYLLGGCGLGTTIAFSLYVTFHPGMKGVVFRPNDAGDKCFTPLNLGRVMASPLYDKNFWKIKLWNVNYIIWLVASTTIAITGKKTYDYMVS